MKVCKFGGTSMANKAQFEKVKAIINSDSERKIVVVSAPGKENKSDYKITDLLYLTYSHIKYHFDYHPIFNQVKQRYFKIKEELDLNIDLEDEFVFLEHRIEEGISEEELVSRGEYFSAKLMANYLGYRFIDAKELFRFDYNGKINEAATLEAMSHYDVGGGIVIPGFYGSYPNGKIALFSRGGSDVSGSYAAKGFHADVYENWTDVSGIYMTSPKIVEKPRKIDQISYLELRELSYSGASVLHEDAIVPFMDNPIPVIIKNTNAPEEDGTIIKKSVEGQNYLLTGIAGKNNFRSFTFVKERSADKLKVILKTLKVFDKYHVSIEHIPTSIDSFSIVVEKSKIEDCYYEVVSELKQIEEIVSISEDDDIALVAVVGENMKELPGTSSRILSVFGKEKINVKLIDQGREEVNIIVGISNKDLNHSIQALYSQFAYEKTK